MRLALSVLVNTDPVPGWGYDPQDWVTLLQKYLDEIVPHYDPKVRIDHVRMSDISNEIG